MFTFKEATTVERYCPTRHTLLDPLPQSNQPIKFCSTCGMPLGERKVTYDAPYCANCDSPVEPWWDYCPYCGQER
ncbi:hypothetical protein ES703_45314 [subsurface metagenome]